MEIDSILGFLVKFTNNEGYSCESVMGAGYLNISGELVKFSESARKDN